MGRFAAASGHLVFHLYAVATSLVLLVLFVRTLRSVRPARIALLAVVSIGFGQLALLL